MRAIADHQAYKMPATIDDPMILEELEAAMLARGMIGGQK
jgi:propionyl-CoA synthetase